MLFCTCMGRNSSFKRMKNCIDFEILSYLQNEKIRLIAPRNHLLQFKLNMETKLLLSSCVLLRKNNQWNGAISKSALNSPSKFLSSANSQSFSVTW